MYNKDKVILSKLEFDLSSYIENGDIYNSKVLYMIPKLPSIGEYTVDLAAKRIDLISLDLYNTTEMSEIILLYNGVTIDQLTKGTVLRVPSLDDIRKLLRSVSSIDSPRDYLKNLEV